MGIGRVNEMLSDGKLVGGTKLLVLVGAAFLGKLLVVAGRALVGGEKDE